MKNFKKNQVIIAALAIMIALAAYLTYTKDTELDEEDYVFNNQSSVASNQKDTSDLDSLPANFLLNDDPKYIKDSEEEESSGENKDSAEAEGDDEKGLEEREAEENKDANTGKGDDSQVGEAVFVNIGQSSGSYFLENKIKREQKRATSMEILLEVINSENITEESKLSAINKMVLLQEKVEKEALAESVLEAKGFEDVLVLIDDETVDVIVRKDDLSEEKASQIIDVVSRKTGISPDAIIINPTN